MKDKIRVGIIGCGGIAGAHAENYLNCERAEIAALCDLVPGKAAAFAERKGVAGANIYASYEEMFGREELDAVSVCTYNQAHADPTIAALRRGVCVLLEKPIAASVEDALRIIRAEKESSAFVSVGFQPRYDPDMQKIKEICQSGELGDIYYIQTGGGRRRGLPTAESFVRRDQAGVGAMGDIGCYSLDMVLNAIGYPKPLTVTGYASDFFGRDPRYKFSGSFNVEDFAAAFIRLEGGIVLDFRISWAMHPDTPGDTIIFGKKGALRIPSTDCWNAGVGGDMTLYYDDENGEPTEKKIPAAPDHGKEDCFACKVRAFVDAVREGGPAPVPSREAFINEAIVNAILDSAEKGGEIVVDLPEV